MRFVLAGAYQTSDYLQATREVQRSPGWTFAGIQIKGESCFHWNRNCVQLFSCLTVHMSQVSELVEENGAVCKRLVEENGTVCKDPSSKEVS